MEIRNLSSDTGSLNNRSKIVPDKKRGKAKWSLPKE
jgi:hypothetical protein